MTQNGDHVEMELRDYFAAHAIAGILAGEQAEKSHRMQYAYSLRPDRRSFYEVAVEKAYAVADAMIAARSANGGAA